MVETINILNLVNINTLVSMVMNFVALGIIADFDEYFVAMFMTTDLRMFSEKKLSILFHRKQKFQVAFKESEEDKPKVDGGNTNPEEVILSLPSGGQGNKLGPGNVIIVDSTKSVSKYDELEFDAEVEERIVKKGVKSIPIHKGEK